MGNQGRRATDPRLPERRGSGREEPLVLFAFPLFSEPPFVERHLERRHLERLREQPGSGPLIQLWDEATVMLAGGRQA